MTNRRTARRPPAEHQTGREPVATGDGTAGELIGDVVAETRSFTLDELKALAAGMVPARIEPMPRGWDTASITIDASDGVRLGYSGTLEEWERHASTIFDRPFGDEDMGGGVSAPPGPVGPERR